MLDSAFGNVPAVTGLVMTAALLGFAVSGLLPEGSDPARTLRRALWLIVAASAVCAAAPWFGVLLAGRMAQGIGVGFLVAGGISDVARSHPAAAGGRLTGSLIGGTAIGGLLSRLSGYTAIWLGWRPAFALGGVLALILCSIALRRLAATSVPVAGVPSHLLNGGPWGGIPWGLVGAGLGILFVNIAVFDLLPYRLARAPFHLPPAIADLIYLAFVPATVTAGLAGRAIDRFGARAVVLATAAAGIVCLLVGLLPWLPAAAVMATGAISATVALHSCHSLTAARFGRVAVGRYLTAYYVGGAIAAPLIAAAYEAFGWAGAVLPLCLATGGVGLLALLSPASRWTGLRAVPTAGPTLPGPP